MSERYEPSAYNPDDPNYKENQSLESKEGKDFSTPSDDNNEPASSTSANDQLQADLQSLRGDYGQNSDPAGDAQSKYEDFKTEQLGGNYGQDGDADSGGDVGSSSVSEGDGGSNGGGGDVGYA